MPAVEPIVNEEKLNECLNEAHESAQLDYKRTCDLSQRNAIVELAKDVGAMMIDGGYIVIGADDHGAIVDDLTEVQGKLFDDATLRGKLDRYFVKPYEIRSALHVKDGHRVVLVYVEPHPQGFCIFAHDGAREDNALVFRKGDVFARHGTASERWQQPDIDRALTRRVRAAKNEWERDALQPLLDRIATGGGAQQIAQGPAEALTWRLDPETFRSAVVEQIRAGDPLPLRLLLNSLPTETRTILDAGENDDFERLVDRVAGVGMLAMEIGDLVLLDNSLECLLAVFETEVGDYTDLRRGADSARVWLTIILRVFGMGAYAVRRGNWVALRSIVLRRSDRWHETHRTWLRTALTMASRSNLLHIDGQQFSMLAHVRSLVSERPYLRPDIADPEDERILNSVCQFDVYAAFAAFSDLHTPNRWGSTYYPSFGHFNEIRSEVAFERLVMEPEIRSVVFPGRSDAELADAIRWLSEAATREGFQFAGWDGFRSAVVLAFLDRNLPPTE